MKGSVSPAIKAKISAVSYAVPDHSIGNEELSQLFPEWPADKIKEKLGIISRHIASDSELSSDLAVHAAEKLFLTEPDLKLQIDYILFCTQSPDYFLPTTACLIQHRLGISKTVGAIDINLGCSGWVYGLGLAKGLIETGQAKNVLFLTGETYSKFLSPADKSTRTLFGDAGSATLIAGIESSLEHIGPFVYGTDGSGAEHLIVHRGGMRQPGLHGDVDHGLSMNGGEIFSFSVREVSKAVEALLAKKGIGLEEIDLFIFHQANAYMLEFLRRKCKIPQEKFYMWYETTGNTVSNTIPIALHHAINEGKATPGMRVMFVGFGVGLSWGACLAVL